MPGIPDKRALQAVLSRAAAVANMLLLVLLCGLLAQWTWNFAGPESKPPMEAPDNSKQVAQLEGQMASIFFAGDDGASNQPAVEPLNVTLIGAFSGKNGFAIVRANDQTQAVTIGEEIAPGAVLAAVKPRSIEVQRNGQTQEVELATSAAGGTAAQANNGDTATDADGGNGGDNAGGDAGAKNAPSQVGLATVRVGRTRVFFTSRELAAAVQKISPQALFGPIEQAGNGGWQLSLVRSDSPGYWIGLRTRDILTEIDGAPIQDASQIYALHQKLQQAGTFKLSGRRARRPLTLVYTTEE